MMRSGRVEGLCRFFVVYILANFWKNADNFETKSSKTPIDIPYYGWYYPVSTRND